MATTSKAPRQREVEIICGRRRIAGILHVPHTVRGIVVFAHGSGSGRFSPRNRFVARELEDAGLATLLVDLLEEDKSEDRRKVFDIPLLAERLQAAADWAKQQPELGSLKLGYFGASTGAGAALVAAARRPDAVSAIVSRGGRPDLANEHLPAVRAPTLLIVGGADDLVLGLNEQAARQLKCEHQLVVVHRATHLFEEPGTLEEVARLASNWFEKHLAHARPRPPTSD
jgi:putative phosphoribosyl transferase